MIIQVLDIQDGRSKQYTKSLKKNSNDKKILIPSPKRKKSISSQDSDEIIQTNIYLYVPYYDKDYVKKLFAKWDSEKKQWYIKNENK